jgi:hypothetical protein
LSTGIYGGLDVSDKTIIKILCGIVLILSVPLLYLFALGTVIATMQGSYWLAVKSCGLALAVLLSLIFSAAELTES